MKVKVDQEVCIGCGMCEGMAEEVFSMNEDGKAQCCQEVTQENESSVQEAIDSCPVAAISWEK